MADRKRASYVSRRLLRGMGMAGTLAGLTVLWLLLFALLGGLAAGGAVAGYVAALVKDEPIRSRAFIEQKINENAITGFVYFRDGTLIGQLRTEEDRRPVTFNEIPQVVLDAVLAIEDNDFFKHPGVDPYGLLRAVKQQLLNESVQTGGSTITQQLARQVFLTLEQTTSRKAREIFLALRLEQFLSKEEIITAYLNKIHFGNGSNGYNVYGIKAAAKGIFGIDNLNDLNIAQAAYLAGLPQRPSAYSAFTSRGEFNETNFKRAVDRQRLVLRRMLEEGKITREQYEEALRFDLRASLAPPSEKAYNTYPYLMLEIERQAAEILVLKNNPDLTKEDLRKKEYAPLVEDARKELLRGGYRIYTTIDRQVYDLMRSIAENPENFAPDHPVKGMEQVAAIMIEHGTGAILGMIEGRDFHTEQMNFATQMMRQPGSAMKPLAAYLPAIDMGLVQPASILDDAPIILADGTGKYHIPKNSNNRYDGLVTARDALNRSINTVALKVFLEKVTIEKAWEFVRKLGITTLVPEDNYAQTGVIGGLRYGVTVEELTNAYGVIANRGVFNDAYLIEEIRNSKDEIVYQHQPSPIRVVSEQSAYLMTDMLRTVISDPSGTGASIRSQFKGYGKIPVAGKTGTTQNYGDVWFVGFTPDITLGVWVGYEKQIHTLGTESRRHAREIWAKIMNAVTETKPELFPTTEFAKPDGIVTMTVSRVSGKLPSELTREAGRLVTDIFNRRDVPKEEDDALVRVKYVSYNGVNYLPNPATPQDMLREAVMVIREKPLDVLMEELEAALPKSRDPRPLSYYLPQDAKESAPSKPDPRVDDGAAPSAPRNVAAEVLDGLVRITFAPSPEADVVGYRLYRSMNGGPFIRQQGAVHTGEELKFINYVSAGNTYLYYVTAVDVVGNESPPSAIVSPLGDSQPAAPAPGGTEIPDWLFPQPDDGGSSGPGDGDPASSPPSAPAGLVASSTPLGIRLIWQANPAEEGVTEYRVWHRPDPSGQYLLVGSTDSTVFEYVMPLPQGSFRVTAVNGAGESPPSAAVEVGSDN